jgi:hypothetical protein
MLEEWFASDPKRTPTSLSRAVGVAGPAVFQWRARKSRPDAETRPLLRLVAGIPESAWETDDERRVRLEREQHAEQARDGLAVAKKAG